MATAADLKRTLDSLNLGFLFDILNKANIDPSIDVSNKDQLANYIDADPDAQTYMKQRFKGNEYRAAAGLRALKPAEYIEQEQAYLSRLRDNGLPIGFYDSQEDLAKLIGGDVGAVEFDARIRQGYQAALKAPQAVRQQLKDLYGVDETELAAYFLDPTRATDVIGRKKNADLMSQQISAAQIAAQGKTQAGFTLGLQTAEELVAAGITPAEAESKFGQILDQQELFRTTTQESMSGEQAITEQEQIAGTFGLNAEARKKIAERKRRRTSAFEQGGSLGATATGVSGLKTVGM